MLCTVKVPCKRGSPRSGVEEVFVVYVAFQLKTIQQRWKVQQAAVRRNGSIFILLQDPYPTLAEYRLILRITNLLCSNTTRQLDGIYILFNCYPTK